MHYPYLFYNPQVRLFPIFPDLKGEPLLVDMSPSAPLLQGLESRDQRGFQQLLEEKMGERFSWGLSPYLERRDTLLGDCPQMVKEQRFIHLGLDIIVDLNTPLHAPLDAVIEESGYEHGEGNYGGFVLLRHESDLFTTFYSFYGHLCKRSLPVKGTVVLAGQPFAEIGDYHENGNWFYHTHLQVLTQTGLDNGYISKGYCSEKDLMTIHEYCPSPLHLLRVSEP